MPVTHDSHEDNDTFELYRENSEISYEYAMACASGLVFCIGCSAMLSNIDLFTAMRNAMKVRVAICSIIYRKVCGVGSIFYRIDPMPTGPTKILLLIDFPTKIVTTAVEYSAR